MESKPQSRSQDLEAQTTECGNVAEQRTAISSAFSPDRAAATLKRMGARDLDDRSKGRRTVQRVVFHNAIEIPQKYGS